MTTEITKPTKRIRRWKDSDDQVLIRFHRGMSAEQIATDLSMQPTSVKRIINMPEFKDKLMRLTKKVEEKQFSVIASEAASKLVDETREKIVSMAPKAAQVLEALLWSTSDKIRLGAVIDILDRCGLKPREVIETFNRSYTPQEIESAKKTLLELEATVQRLSNEGNRFVIEKRTDSPVSSLDGQGSMQTKPLDTVPEGPQQDPLGSERTLQAGEARPDTQSA